jgi:hypothetical protein
MMGFMQEFHLVIIIKKDTTNKLIDMLSRPLASKFTMHATIMHMDPLTHEAYKEEYLKMKTLRECI